jgi:hypothetical protein
MFICCSLYHGCTKCCYGNLFPEKCPHREKQQQQQQNKNMYFTNISLSSLSALAETKTKSFTERLSLIFKNCNNCDTLIKQVVLVGPINVPTESH